MSGERIELHGEVFVTLETAAAWYRVERRWVEEVYSAGLLDRAERVEGTLAVPATELDRLAAVLRWNRHHGLDLEAVLALLGS